MRALGEGWANSSTARNGTTTRFVSTPCGRNFRNPREWIFRAAALLAISSRADLELAVDPVYESRFMYETMGQAQMSGTTPGAQAKESPINYVPTTLPRQRASYGSGPCDPGDLVLE